MALPPPPYDIVNILLVIAVTIHNARHVLVAVQEPEPSFGALDLAPLESDVHALSLTPLQSQGLLVERRVEGLRNVLLLYALQIVDGIAHFLMAPLHVGGFVKFVNCTLSDWT